MPIFPLLVTFLCHIGRAIFVSNTNTHTYKHKTYIDFPILLPTSKQVESDLPPNKVHSLCCMRTLLCVVIYTQ